MAKQILHITVKSDQHGNRPTQSQINAVARKFRRAVAETGYHQAVVVTDDHVVVKTIAAD